MSIAPVRIHSRNPCSRELVLTARERHGRGVAEGDVVVEVVGGQRLLEPEHVVGFQHLGELERIGQLEAPGAVDQQITIGADDLAGGGHGGDVVVPVPAGAHLDPREPPGDRSLTPGCHGVGRAVEHPAGVRRHETRRATEQTPHRLTLHLAAQVPHRLVDPADRADRRTLASVPATDAVQTVPVPFGLAGVVAEHERREVVDGRLHQRRMGVGGSDADETVVGGEADERRQPSRRRSPGRRERPLGRHRESQVQALDPLDGGHERSPGVAVLVVPFAHSANPVRSGCHRRRPWARVLRIHSGVSG